MAASTNGTIIHAATTYNIPEVINKGLAYAILLAGLLSVVFIIVGGFSFILSGGAEDKIKQAVGTIRYAIIGLIVTIFSVIVVSAVGQFIGLDVVKYLNVADIFKSVQSIGDTMKSNSNSSGGTVSLD